MNIDKKNIRIVSLLAAIGILATAYLVFQHYKTVGGSFCNVNDYVNCDIVNKSRYAEIFGIPVSILGFLAYVMIFFTTLGLLRGWNFEKISQHFTSRFLMNALTVFSGIGLLFSLYLTYVEFFVLQAVCLFCVTQQILILLIFLILLSLCFKKEKLPFSS